MYRTVRQAQVCSVFAILYYGVYLGWTTINCTTFCTWTILCWVAGNNYTSQWCCSVAQIKTQWPSCKQMLLTSLSHQNNSRSESHGLLNLGCSFACYQNAMLFQPWALAISFSFCVHILSHRYTHTDMHTQCTPFQWSLCSLWCIPANSTYINIHFYTAR